MRNKIGESRRHIEEQKNNIIKEAFKIISHIENLVVLATEKLDKMIENYTNIYHVYEHILQRDGLMLFENPTSNLHIKI